MKLHLICVCIVHRPALHTKITETGVVSTVFRFEMKRRNQNDKRRINAESF